MLKTKSFLAVDFGAGSLKLAEFEVNEAGGLRLKQYGIRPLGAEGAQESTREAAILKALQELLSEKGIKAKDVNVCAPGFHVFSKFVKLPPVDTGKVTQIIQYEAQQNVPFPLQEVVWDYQILGTTAGGELEVLLVAIKSDIVEGLFRVVESAKLRLQVADVSPAALCNAFRYNYGDLEDCTMLLDIGAKTCNLLFFEKGKIFSRSINLGANSITQDFANEVKLKFDPAEKIKIEEGFVSLGGAYEEPENQNQAAISKIARQFMTRLHIQVNQTMQFYRGQQGGSAPQRLFLSGGASLMPYTAQFFAEKLNMPVEYFNPFRNVQIDPVVNLEDLARVAHSLGEVVGLGLRNLARCPVELNLIPESTRRWQSFNEKKPYLVATVFSLVAVVAATGLLFQQLAKIKKDELDTKVMPILEPLRQKEIQFKSAMQGLSGATNEMNQLTMWMGSRYYWGDVLTEFRRLLIRTEVLTQQKLNAETGIWLEKMLTVTPLAGTETIAVPSDTPAPYNPYGAALGGASALPNPYGAYADAYKRGGQPPPTPTPDQPATTAGGATTSSTNVLATAGTNQISTITFVCRAVNAPGVSDATIIIQTLIEQVNSSPFFDPKETKLTGQISSDQYTFSFPVSVVLKHPLKL